MAGTLLQEAGTDVRRHWPVVYWRHLFRGQRLLLVAVGLVVVLVSLPLLRSLALKENEFDAIRALDLLGREAFAAENSARSLGELLGGHGDLAGRLPDTRLLADGRVMFHHGYLFELIPTPDGGRVLRAWPLAHGETGLGAFWISTPGRLLGHPNAAARWSGLGSAPPLEFKGSESGHAPESAPGTGGWRPLEFPQGHGSGM